MEFPTAFWHWWGEREQAGADAVLLSCLDGEAGQYAVKALRTTDLNAEEVAAGNTRVREAAAEVVKRTRAGVRPVDLAHRLLARGIYHGEAAPDPLREVLLGAEGQFFLESMQITYRPELTPTLRRLFAPRLSDDLRLEDGLLRESLGLPLQPEPEPRADLGAGSDDAPPRPAERGYRIKVTFLGRPGVWRVIEMLDNQTLEDLHYAIQEAFGWDDDHLYAFFLSGRAWDATTEVDRPFLDEDAEPPLADQVTLADMEPVPGQQFLYIFDFGDELSHDIKVLEPFPLPARGKFPRISERHGKAPVQYREWD